MRLTAERRKPWGSAGPLGIHEAGHNFANLTELLSAFLSMPVLRDTGDLVSGLTRPPDGCRTPGNNVGSLLASVPSLNLVQVWGVARGEVSQQSKRKCIRV